MFNPVLLPKSSGSGSSGPSPVRHRVLKFGTADHIKYITSTAVSKADIIAAIDAVESGLDPRQVELEFMAIPASGAGASGETAFGGLAGIVATRNIWLSDIPDDGFSVDIGAGGLGVIGGEGMAGSMTTVDFADGRPSILAFGGYGGYLTTEVQRRTWFYAVGQGARYGDPGIVKDGPSNPFGPGCGGGREPGYPGSGGGSSTADNSVALYTPGFDYGIAGSDASPNLFGQFGSGGGSGDGTVPGGKGGIPGGAGGASPPDLAGGPGERGEVRIRVHVWETL